MNYAGITLKERIVVLRMMIFLRIGYELHEK